VRRVPPVPLTSPTFSGGGKFTRIPQAGGRDWLSNYFYAVASYADNGLAGDYLVYGTNRVLDIDYANLYDDIVSALGAEGLIDRVFDPEPLAGTCLIWGDVGDSLFGLVEGAYNVDYTCLKTRMIADGLGGSSGEKYQGLTSISITGPQGSSLDYQMTFPYGGTIEHLEWSTGTPCTTSFQVCVAGTTVFTSSTWWDEAVLAIPFTTAATLQLVMTCTGWPGAVGFATVYWQEEPA